MLLLLSPGTGTGLLATRGLDRSRQGPPPGAASASAQPVAGDSLAAPSRLGIPRVVFLPSGGGGDDLSEFDLPPAPREGEYGSALASPLAGEYADWGSLARLPPAQLRGSDLNELLQPDSVQRLRFVVSPMEAYGALFRWDTVFAGLRGLHAAAWAEVAEAHGLPFDAEDSDRTVGRRPEIAVTQVFRWQPALDDWGVAQALSYEFCEALGRRFSSYAFEPRPGAVRLLTLLNEYQVPCCLCSELDERSLSDKVEAADMARFFQASICAEDGAETAEQAYLASCVKLRRPPARCVVFEDSPQGVSSAKEALAKAVALVGKHPAYEMMHADLRISSLEDLTLMAIRELFSGEEPR